MASRRELLAHFLCHLGLALAVNLSPDLKYEGIVLPKSLTSSQITTLEILLPMDH